MKVSEIIGLKVITVNTGTQIDDIDDVVYDPKVNAVTALLVDKGGWFSDAKVILFKDINTIGQDAVLIANETVIKKASELVPGINEIIKGNTFLTNTKVLTQSGKNLGTISDLLFDQKSGTVSFLEVSQGPIKNLQSGKKNIPINDIVTIGKDRLIVKSVTEQQIAQQAQNKGMQGAAKNTQEKTKRKASDVVQNIQSGFTNVKQKASEAMGEFNNQYAVKELKKNLNETKENIKKSLPNNKQQKHQNTQKKQSANKNSNKQMKQTQPQNKPIKEHKTIFRSDMRDSGSRTITSNM